MLPNLEYIQPLELSEEILTIHNSNFSATRWTLVHGTQINYEGATVDV